jgi:hypothetical protein
VSETRIVFDPFLNQEVEVSDRLVDRLRGRYASGPHLPNGNPEFGWRQFEAPPIQHEAASRIEQLESELEAICTGLSRKITLSNETIINGIRYDAGEYVLIRIGPPKKDPTF